MNRGADRFEELRSLLDALCEESITADQLARLEALVLDDPEAEALYIQWMQLHSELVHEFGGGAPSLEEIGLVPEAPAASPTGAGRVPRDWPRLLRWPALGATAAALVLIATLSLRPTPGPRPPSEPVDDHVAVLLHAVGAKWEDTGVPTHVGAPLPAGRLKLTSGLAWIEFYCGATVILEGPADFELRSSERAFCRQGRLRAHVPPQARGFTIASPRLDLVDRGTEFGIAVGESGRTEVYVFEGAVDLYGNLPGPSGLSHKRLTTGSGLRIEQDGGVSPAAPDPATFVSSQEVAARFEAEAVERQRTWIAASAQLRRDPTLLAYYPFEDAHAWDRTLRDQAGDRTRPRDGVVIGCHWGDGRWPGKGALEFRKPSDRVRIRIPGEYDSLTFAAWVRVDGLDNSFNSLMLTDGFGVGEVHWQVREDGRIYLGVHDRPTHAYMNYMSPVIFRKNSLGQWAHLAVVYDGVNNDVSHFVDGQEVSREPTRFDIPLRIGDAEIGNWNPAASRNARPIRNLNGVIDEFMIFSRALTPSEIARMYSDGAPRS